MMRFTAEKQRSADALETGMVMATAMHSTTKLNAPRNVSNSIKLMVGFSCSSSPLAETNWAVRRASFFRTPNNLAMPQHFWAPGVWQNQD